MNITYRFTFPDERQEVFEIRLDPNSILMEDPLPEELQEWTLLDFHKCPHCPLDSNLQPHCPPAARIAGIVDRFAHILSHQQVLVEVDTAERKVSKHTTTQQGLSSLLGLVMATSGCPHMALFKPMAAFHLPLSSPDETVYRAASMFLLAQYYISKETGNADLSLQGLGAIYRRIELLNEHMAERIRAGIDKDAAINALVELDFFAKSFTLGIEKRLEEMRHLFIPYIGQII
jgi:hypothetical protein